MRFPGEDGHGVVQGALLYLSFPLLCGDGVLDGPVFELGSNRVGMARPFLFLCPKEGLRISALSTARRDFSSEFNRLNTFAILIDQK